MKTLLFVLGECLHTRQDRLPVLAAATERDVVLLHQDGVYSLAPEHPALAELRRRGVRVVACAPDCRARGIALPEDAVDWQGFIALMEETGAVVS